MGKGNTCSLCWTLWKKGVGFSSDTVIRANLSLEIFSSSHCSCCKCYRLETGEKQKQTKPTHVLPPNNFFFFLLLYTTDEVAHLLFCLVYTVHSWSEMELRGSWNHFLRPHVRLFSLQWLTTSLEKGLKAEIWVCLENNTY